MQLFVAAVMAAVRGTTMWIMSAWSMALRVDCSIASAEIINLAAQLIKVNFWKRNGEDDPSDHWRLDTTHKGGHEGTIDINGLLWSTSDGLKAWLDSARVQKPKGMRKSQEEDPGSLQEEILHDKEGQEK